MIPKRSHRQHTRDPSTPQQSHRDLGAHTLDPQPSAARHRNAIHRAYTCGHSPPFQPQRCLDCLGARLTLGGPGLRAFAAASVGAHNSALPRADPLQPHVDNDLACLPDSTGPNRARVILPNWGGLSCVGYELHVELILLRWIRCRVVRHRHANPGQGVASA